MAMDLNAKAAYIRGLMTGMEFDPASKNGKVIAAMMDLLEEMAASVTSTTTRWIRSTTSWKTLDQDLDDVVADLYGEEDEDEESDDEEDGEELYEVTCPNCGAVSTVTRRRCWTSSPSWFALTAARL